MAVFGPVGQVASQRDLLIAGNNDVSTLATPCDGVQTAIQLPLGEGAKFVAFQAIVLDQEAMRIESIAVDILTVTRGYDNTAAVPHTAGTAVVDRPIAAHHNRTTDEVIAIEAFLTTGFTRNVDAGARNIFNLADPRNGAVGTKDAATRDYVDNMVAAGTPLGRYAYIFQHMGA